MIRNEAEPTNSGGDSGHFYQIIRAFVWWDANAAGRQLVRIIKAATLVRALGIDAVRVVPIFPRRGHFGYDISDYHNRHRDPLFGTMDDFGALIYAAHDKRAYESSCRPGCPCHLRRIPCLREPSFARRPRNATGTSSDPARTADRLQLAVENSCSAQRL